MNAQLRETGRNGRQMEQKDNKLRHDANTNKARHVTIATALYIQLYTAVIHLRYHRVAFFKLSQIYHVIFSGSYTNLPYRNICLRVVWLK